MAPLQLINKPQTNLRYRPDIDGLRALAILSVVFFHLGIPRISGGFVGVDIFFVISGFLITRIIYDEFASTGSFSFGNFYIRRIRRLFPALVFTFALALIAGFFLFALKFFDSFSRSLLSALFSVSNFYFWKTSDYFAPAAEFEPLLHTWSLSVEEQFYLLWPITLIFLVKRFQKPGVTIFLIAISLISLAMNAAFKDHSELIFYLLPFRVFEFAIGALLVWLVNLQPSDKRWLEALAAIGFALIAYSVVCFTKFTIFPYFNALIPCIGAALLIYAGQAKYAGKILGNRSLVGIGLISYSLYLIHWPMIALYKYYKDIDSLTYPEMLVIGMASLIIAYLMYRFVEQPFRRVQKGDGKNRKFLLNSLAIFVTVGILAIYVRVGEGLEWRIDSFQNYQNVDYGGKNYPWETTLGNPESPNKLIVYGDSHSKQYLFALDGLAKENNLWIQYIGHSACISWPNLTNIYKDKTHQSCIDMLGKLKSATEGNNIPVMIAYRYTKTIVGSQGNNPINHQDGKVFIDRLFNGLDELHLALGNDRKLIVMGGVPAANLKRGYMDCISRPLTYVKCHDKNPVNDSEFFKLRLELEKYKTQRSNVIFLDPYLALCDEIYCYVAKDNILYYSDHAHLTADGASTVIDMFSDDILNVIGSSTK